jgi:hypothetical protein
MSILKLYPGSLWFKRLGYITLVYSIGINAVVGIIQNTIIQGIEKKTNDIEETNEYLASREFPNLEIIKIEPGSRKEKLYNGTKEVFEDYLNIKIISLDRINEIATLSNTIKSESAEIHKHINTIQDLLKIILKVIKITSNLIWISIAWAILWLYFDIRKGNAKGFVKLCLLVSIPFNLTTFYILNNYLKNFFEL